MSPPRNLLRRFRPSLKGRVGNHSHHRFRLCHRETKRVGARQLALVRRLVDLRRNHARRLDPGLPQQGQPSWARARKDQMERSGHGRGAFAI